jgi:hypothetical protein
MRKVVKRVHLELYPPQEIGRIPGRAEQNNALRNYATLLQNMAAMDSRVDAGSPVKDSDKPLHPADVAQVMMTTEFLPDGEIFRLGPGEELEGD